MSLSGKLEDISLLDILQFIQLGRKTGSLFLWAREGRATLAFKNGNIERVWGPRPVRLSDLLRQNDLIGEHSLSEARSLHTRDPSRRLAQILVQERLVGQEALSDVVAGYMKKLIAELAQWKQGTFDFTHDARLIESNTGEQGFEALPSVEVSTQSAVLEAATDMDHQTRDTADLTMDAVERALAPPSSDAEDVSLMPHEPLLMLSPKVPARPPRLRGRTPNKPRSPSQPPLAPGDARLELRLTDADMDRVDLALQLADAEHEVARLSKLYVALYQLHASLVPGEVEATIQEIMADLLGAEHFALLLASEDPAAHEIVLSVGSDPRFERFCADKIYRGGDPFIDSTLRDAVFQVEPVPGSIALAAVPLIIQGRRAGALAIFKLFDHKKGLYAEDRELLNMLASHAAMALCAARVYSNTMRKLRTLEGLVDLLRVETFTSKGKGVVGLSQSPR